MLLNAVNRGFYIADNLDFLRALNEESVDLISVDPPFGTNRSFYNKRQAHYGEQEMELLESWNIKDANAALIAGITWPASGYSDKNFIDVDTSEWDGLTDAVRQCTQAAQTTHSNGISAYMLHMAPRLVEMHRVLKPTGSLWWHCDQRTNAYMRQLLDAVFGERNFRNEVIWCYAGGGTPARDYPRKHDTIYRYSKSDDYVFNTEYRSYGVHNVNGRRATDNQGTRKLQYNERGTPVNDWWDDIKPLINWNSESVGYPTQKPSALAERIIKASTAPGDVVIDCFAGTGATGIAAERLGRRWVLCDSNPRCWTLFDRRMPGVGEVYGPHQLPSLEHSDELQGT